MKNNLNFGGSCQRRIPPLGEFFIKQGLLNALHSPVAGAQAIAKKNFPRVDFKKFPSRAGHPRRCHPPFDYAIHYHFSGTGDTEVLVMGGSPPKGADGSVEAVVADTPGGGAHAEQPPWQPACRRGRDPS